MEQASKIIGTYPNWMIVKRVNRGYRPYFTLHKKRSFLWFEWWSGSQGWSIDLIRLQEFILRWEGFTDEL